MVLKIRQITQGKIVGGRLIPIKPNRKRKAAKKKEMTLKNPVVKGRMYKVAGGGRTEGLQVDVGREVLLDPRDGVVPPMSTGARI